MVLQPARRRLAALSFALHAAVLSMAWPAGVQAAPGYASTAPAARVEHWQKRQADITVQLKDSAAMAAVKLVFVGDSITDFWLLDEDPWFKGRFFGRSVWAASFGGGDPANRALNIGISGDRTEHVLHRLLPVAQGGLGHLDAPGLKPEFLVVMLGINNTWAAEEPVADSVFEGVRAVLLALRQRQPAARIVLQSILPTNDPQKNADVVLPVNQRLQALASTPPFAGKLLYLDLVPGFVDAQGQQIGRLFTDGLHPNADGYRVWRDRLVPFLAAARR